MRLTVVLSCIFVLLIVYLTSIECKRSGGGRSKGRSSSSSSSFWNRKKTSGSSSSSSGRLNEPKPVPNSYPKQETAPKPAPKPAAAAPAPAPAPKPSAPVEDHVVKKEQSNLQQSSPNQRPVGWDVNQPATSQNAHKTAQAPPPYSQNPPGQVPPPYGAPGHAQPPYGAAGQAPPPYGAQGHAPPPYGQAPPPYGQAPPSYGQAPPPYGQAPGYQPQQPHMGPPPAYSPYPQQPYNNMGGMGQNMGGNGYNNMGGMGYNNMGGMGYNNMGGMGYPQKSGGFMGGLFGGGNRGGFGGYNPYGVQKSSGFFGKHAFRNILGGVLVWYAIKGIFRRPYTVYNYYNQPESTEKIQLPANILTLCEENSGNMCVPGSTAICTTNNTILCVTTMNAAVPCPEQNQTLCVNSTVPCVDKDDPLCQNKTTGTDTANINLPCFANVTVDVNLLDYAATNGSVKNRGKDYNYCVTAMAVAGPEEPNCPDQPVADNATTNPACVKPIETQTPVPILLNQTNSEINAPKLNNISTIEISTPTMNNISTILNETVAKTEPVTPVAA